MKVASRKKLGRVLRREQEKWYQKGPLSLPTLVTVEEGSDVGVIGDIKDMGADILIGVMEELPDRCDGEE